jgi:hypothetical protein
MLLYHLLLIKLFKNCVKLDGFLRKLMTGFKEIVGKKELVKLYKVYVLQFRLSYQNIIDFWPFLKAKEVAIHKKILVIILI